VADVDEDAVGVDRALFAGDDVAGADAGDLTVVAEHLLDDGVPHEAHLRVGERPLLRDLVRAQLVAAVDDRHGVANLVRNSALLDGRVAAADDHHVLAAVEEAVAGGAGRDAATVELVLAGDAERRGWRRWRR
jgi:hypothetical protein